MWRTLWITGALFALATGLPFTEVHDLEIRKAPNTFAELSKCPGYSASIQEQTSTSLTANLKLSGEPCNAYGADIESLILTVTYETENRLHVKIEDAERQAYQVPTSVFPRPKDETIDSKDSALEFSLDEKDFSFTIKDRASGEVIFDSSAAQLVFEDQYLRLRTALPEDPNLYGLGEHSDSFRLNTTDYTRTMWSRDAFGIPEGGNLYGNHPIYFDHRGDKGTYGVFLLSSSGMDVKINRTADDGQYLEYNVLGGVIDLYFLAGKTPTDVSKEYAQVAGLPAMHSYWALGFHTCRYGYRDFYAVAETITNYSAAGIPLETQWTDIDYMYERWVFTLDPERFPLARVRDIVDFLHAHNQHYIVMVDPAVAYQNYTSFSRGVEDGIFMKYDNGTIFKGVVWPGTTAFPDWFHPNAQEYWDTEFLDFFDPENGVDIDGLWIDMNEAANFCPFPCPNPEQYAELNKFPPGRPFVRSQPRPIPGFPPEFQPGASDAPADSLPYNDPNLAPASSPGTLRRAMTKKQKRQANDFSSELDTPVGLPGRNLLAPPYRIDNDGTYFDEGGLSNQTIRTDLHHHNGLVDLDVHNLYGTMMSEVSRGAMLARKSNERPLIITRSTFAGAGRNVGKWLGDNLSTWDHYRNQIQGMLDFSALFQIPMVGSDVCGFGQNTTETLCARWAMLGAFNPFYRNHNQDSALPQEFYIWPIVTEAAKKAIDIRYRLLDYFYTALYEQTVDGTPSINPMFFKYPSDPFTFGIDLQFFYGHSILVSPVTEENATDVDIYLPKDIFYDFYDFSVVQGTGSKVTLSNIELTDIPLHIRGGSIIPMREESAMTTTELRTKPFNIVVAPSADGTASGSLYLDDGISVEQKEDPIYLKFAYKQGSLSVKGNFGHSAEKIKVSCITILNVKEAPRSIWTKPKTSISSSNSKFDESSRILKIDLDSSLEEDFVMEWK